MGYSPDSIKEICEWGMVIGGLAAIEHYLSNGRWTDEDKDECHGKYGILLFAASTVGRLLCEPQESY